MVDRLRLDQLLTLLERYVTVLRELATTPLPQFVGDPRDYGSAERFLQLAIETVLSIGNHLIADAGFGQPGTYAEIIAVLGREGVLDPDLATELEPMARMRNRLVHHYQDVSPEQVHEILATRLGDFDRFAEQVVAYADRN